MAEQSHRAAAPYLDDPVAFARELHGRLGADGDPRLVTPTPESYGAYTAAVRRLGELLPAEATVAGAVNAADELAHAWAIDAHAAGIEFGVAAERLRRVILGGADGPRIPPQTAGQGWEPGRT